MIDTNLVYDIDRIGLGKSYISGASCYPPQLKDDCTIGVFDNNAQTSTNCYLDGQTKRDVTFNVNVIDDINYECDDVVDCILGDTRIVFTINENNKSVYTVSALSDIELVEENVDDVIDSDDNAIVIKNKNTKWHVTVPIRTEKGDVIKIKLFADPGANAGCVRTDWAWEHFQSHIRKNKRSSRLLTPGGPVIPKFVLWLTFPAKSGKILKARMYLMDHLPVPILADINMLRAWV